MFTAHRTLPLASPFAYFYSENFNHNQAWYEEQIWHCKSVITKKSSINSCNRDTLNLLHYFALFIFDVSYVKMWFEDFPVLVYLRAVCLFCVVP